MSQTRRNSQLGLTLVEVMVAAVIGGIIMGASMQLLNFLKRHQEVTLVMTARDQELNGVISSIGANVGLFDMSFELAPPQGQAPSSTNPFCTNLPESSSNPFADCALYNAMMTPTATMSSTSTVPIAWSKDLVASPADCVGCEGKMGYVIQPMQEYEGLYLVTVWVTHRSLTRVINSSSGSVEKPLEYRFITSFK